MKHMKQMDMSTEKKYSLINYNFKLVLFVIAAMIMGTITICSVRPDFQTKQLIGVGACVIGMIIVSLIDYNFICKYYMILYAGNILLLLLVLLVGSGGGDQGVRRWFYISDSFTIQPSEFAKVIVIIYLAVYYEKNIKKLDNEWIFIKPIILVTIVASLVLIQPDMGTAFIIMVIAMLMFYAVPVNKKYRSIFNKIIIGGIIVVALVLITTGGSFLKDYQLERFNFTKPCERYQEKSGYQLCNSFIAFKNGGIKGQGLGASTQKYLYLPESYTDFIFPIIVEEWGLIVGIAILIAYMIVLYRIIKIARKATTLRNSLICYGVFCYLLCHIMINLLGVMGVIPLTGVPLPFLSYGGSYAICLMTVLGLVQRVSIETNSVKEKQIR